MSTFWIFNCSKCQINLTFLIEYRRFDQVFVSVNDLDQLTFELFLLIEYILQFLLCPPILLFLFFLFLHVFSELHLQNLE
jgi:hypothetical protein